MDTTTRIDYIADGEANRYHLINLSNAHWLAALQCNGVAPAVRQEAMLRRLAACWNAFAGVETEEIEKRSFKVSQPLVRVFNLLTDEVQTFGEHTSPEWAVAYAWCKEHGRLNWLFRHWNFQSKSEAVYRELPFTFGQNSVACGDWAVVRTEECAA